MSNTEPRPKVPNTMSYTDEERALAREVQGKRGSERRGGKLARRLGAGAALVAVGVGSVVGYNTITGGNDADRREPGTSAPAEPGKDGEQISAVPEFGLSVAEFQGNPQALTQAYYEQLNAFRIAGIPDEKPDRAYEITPEEFVDEVGAPVNEAFKEAMFAPGWEQDDSLASYVANNEEVARFVRETRLRSMSGTQERYSETMTAVDVSTVSESPLTIRSDWEQVTSGGEGIVTDESLQTDTGSDLITWGEFDGQYKIVDVEDGSPS